MSSLDWPRAYHGIYECMHGFGSLAYQGCQGFKQDKYTRIYAYMYLISYRLFTRNFLNTYTGLKKLDNTIQLNFLDEILGCDGFLTYPLFFSKSIDSLCFGIISKIPLFSNESVAPSPHFFPRLQICNHSSLLVIAQQISFHHQPLAIFFLNASLLFYNVFVHENSWLFANFSLSMTFSSMAIVYKNYWP